MVFPESPDDSPPFPLSSSASFSLSASASLQTHLSSFNSEQRLRSFPSATGDLEKQTDPDPDDSDDEADDDDKTSQSAAKQRLFWLVKVFVSFSALFFPISVYRDSGVFSPRQSVKPLGEDYQSGPHDSKKGRVSTKQPIRKPRFPLGEQAALVQDNHPRPST